MALTDVMTDGGAAIGCAGGLVMGYWYAPFNSERLRICGEGYAKVIDRHGAFTIFAIFRVAPYTLSSVLSEQLRNETVAVLHEYIDKAAKIIIVFDGSPLTVAAMRVSAAATVRVIKRASVLRFFTSLDEALAEAVGVPGAIAGDEIRAHLVELEHAAAQSAPPKTFPGIARPSWARVDGSSSSLSSRA
jgi:hypothetical protein